jgi:hypothetical protein
MYKLVKKKFQKINCAIILTWNFIDEIIKFLKKEVKFKGYIITILSSVKILKC